MNFCDFLKVGSDQKIIFFLWKNKCVLKLPNLAGKLISKFFFLPYIHPSENWHATLAWYKRNFICHVFAHPPSGSAPMNKSNVFSPLLSTNFLCWSLFPIRTKLKKNWKYIIFNYLILIWTILLGVSPSLTSLWKEKLKALFFHFRKPLSKPAPKKIAIFVIFWKLGPTKKIFFFGEKQKCLRIA